MELGPRGSWEGPKGSWKALGEWREGGDRDNTQIISVSPYVVAIAIRCFGTIMVAPLIAPLIVLVVMVAANLQSAIRI